MGDMDGQTAEKQSVTTVYNLFAPDAVRIFSIE